MGAAMVIPGQFTPAEWIALDIETAGGRPEDAEAWMRLNWAPSDKWKPETIGARYLELLAKKRERLALLDASQVIAVAVRTPMELGCFHSMQASPAAVIEGGAFVQGFGSEREMLAALRGFLAARASEETLVVGHNIISFDLPRLRIAFLRNGLQLPPVFHDPAQPVFDSMREYCRRFSADTDNGAMISLADMLPKLGMKSHKDLTDGGNVPTLYAAGQFEAIAKYALLDVATEAEAFLRLTGRSAALA